MTLATSSSPTPSSICRTADHGVVLGHLEGVGLGEAGGRLDVARLLERIVRFDVTLVQRLVVERRWSWSRIEMLAFLDQGQVLDVAKRIAGTAASRR